MKRFSKIYNKIEESVLVISLMITVLIIALQIFFRYVIKSSLPWSEELTRFIFIWQIWLGTSYAMQNTDDHLRVTLLYDRMNGIPKKIVGSLSDIIFFAFCVYLTVSGAKLVIQLFNRHTLSTALRIPMYLVYMALPISCLCCSVRLVDKIIKDLKEDNE